MNNANLSQEISRLYKDLSDHILARNWEGASRIYQELLRAGQSSDMLIARVPALQNTSALKLFGQQQAAQEHGSGILDSPTTQGSVEPGFTRGSIIERAADRLEWTNVLGTRPDARRGLEETRNQQSQTEPERVVRVLGLRFGGGGPASLPLSFCLILVSILAVGAAGTAVFLLTRSAQENTTAESAPVPEATEKASQNTSPIRNLPMASQAAGAAQSATPTGLAQTAVPTLTVGKLGAEPESGITPSGPALGGPVPTIARTQSNKPEVAMTPATPTGETASTVVPPASPKPPTRPAFSGVEVTALLARGDWLFATGDVDAARLLYERVAEAGEAQGAMRLGESFDPVFLNRAQLRQARPDAGMAVFWYRRARDLGATGITSRLKSLEAKAP
jgi:hypothetical protein